MNILIVECNMVERRCIHSFTDFGELRTVSHSFSKDRLITLFEKGKYILIRTGTVDL